eukprot:9126167-Pyramimonas_sp.AAC.1
MDIDAQTLCVDWRPKAFGTPPPWACRVRDFRSYMMGRLARAREMQLPPRRLVHHFLNMAVALRQIGWGPRAFHQVYYMSRALPRGEESEIFLLIMRLMSFLPL